RPFSARQPTFEGPTPKRPVSYQTKETGRGEKHDCAARKRAPDLQGENAASQEHKDADPGERNGSGFGGPRHKRPRLLDGHGVLIGTQTARRPPPPQPSNL